MMTPPLVQEALPLQRRFAQEQFVFLACQQGTENSLKRRWLGENSPFRLAFSRPGLLTFKIIEPLQLDGSPPGLSEGDSPAWAQPLPQPPRANPPVPPIGPIGGPDRVTGKATQAVATARQAGGPSFDRPPADWLIRQSGWVLGQIRDASANQLVAETFRLAGHDWDAVHVFPRDAGLPGMRGFEVGLTPLTQQIAGQLQREWKSAEKQRVNSETPIGSRVLDVLLVEPDHWLIGWHQAEQLYQQWPGGAYGVAPPDPMVSRAYLKMAEAIAWSELPIEVGDAIVEIGSAPGGASQRLLDLGLKVTGVDPAPMHPLVLQHARFEHWRGKSATIRRRRYAKFRWLAADANVAPNYTLDCVEDIVKYPTSRIEGVLLTLKLSTYDLLDHLEAYCQRVQGWGYSNVRVRQLASNRRECCLVAY